MKHEHNFLLYGIASGFLLVGGAMLISDIPFSKDSQMANVVGVQAIVLEEGQKTSSVSGEVWNNEETIPVSQRELLLFRENSQGEIFLFDTTITDNEGTYVFRDLPPGQYGIRFIQKEGEVVTLPPRAISNFSYASNILLFSIDARGKNYQDMDFHVEKQ